MEWFTSLIFFWEASKILSVLNAHMILVFTLERLVEEKNKYKDWLAFSKTLTNTKDWSESLCHWQIFFCFHPLLDTEKIFLNLHVLSGLIFQDQRQVL
jgi:hypothetical protein